MVYIEIFTAVYMLLVVMKVETRNARSFLIFKALPLFMGLCLLADGFARLGWIVQVP